LACISAFPGAPGVAVDVIDVVVPVVSAAALDHIVSDILQSIEHTA
jgi:hypothetical protein